MSGSKTAIYVRVSSTDGRQSVEMQKIRLLQYATDNNLTFDLYEEQESTRKTRPIKQLLLAKLRAGEYAGGLLCWKLDRWARSLVELVELTEFNDRKIPFKSLTDNIDLTSASGRFYLHLICAFAEFERSLISERSREGLRRKKLKEGYRPGRQIGAIDKKPRKRRVNNNIPPLNMEIGQNLNKSRIAPPLQNAI